MKIVLSRKGFDSSSGGGPSPIIHGVPRSLPIPAGEGRPGISYAELGLADHAAMASRGKLGGDSLAHHDPMFPGDGTCLFGQCGAAQSHLQNQGVGVGDLFLFFGLFREDGARPHHRVFGWLWVDEVVRLAECDAERLRPLREIRHPHAIEPNDASDVIWAGRGSTARSAHRELRLTVEEGPPSLWRIPAWIERAGLSYHGRADRWLGEGVLRSASRGQEFVADMGDDPEAHGWAHRMLALMA